MTLRPPHERTAVCASSFLHILACRHVWGTTLSIRLSSRERLCAFCYCGSRSLLGQGDLQVFSITPQLEALFSNKDGGGSASDSSDGDKTTQPKMPGETTSGQRAKTK